MLSRDETIAALGRTVELLRAHGDRSISPQRANGIMPQDALGIGLLMRDGEAEWRTLASELKSLPWDVYRRRLDEVSNQVDQASKDMMDAAYQLQGYPFDPVQLTLGNLEFLYQGIARFKH